MDAKIEIRCVRRAVQARHENGNNFGCILSTYTGKIGIELDVLVGPKFTYPQESSSIVID